MILQLSFSSAYASGETIAEAQGLPGGPFNPCGGGFGFQLTSFTPPPGASLSKIMWYYGNGHLVGTTTDVTTVQFYSVRENDGNWTFNCYAIVYYSNGSTAQSNTIGIGINLIALNAISQSGPAVLNCPSPVTFSTSFVGGLTYTPTPADVTSYTWSFPSSGWTIASSSGGSNGLTPTVTVTPDASSAGNVMVTTTLNCGYAFTSPVLAITRPTQPPTFGANPTPVCNNSANTFTINPSCGATSYIWTLSGNAGATFQASGTQSLTTTATSAVVSTGSVNSSGATLSVEAVYPGGVTSSAATDNIVTGTPAPTVPRIIDGEMLTGSGPFSFSMITLTSQPVTGYNWIVAPEATISGKTTSTVSFTTPKLNSGQSGDVYITAEYETACGGWVSSQQYYFLDQGSGVSGLPPPPRALTLQPRAGMSQLAIITNNQEDAAVNGDSTAYALKSVLYTIKAVNVYNTTGQLMKKASFGGANTTEYLDIHDLPNGIYFVRVMTSKGSMTEKFAVLH